MHWNAPAKAEKSRTRSQTPRIAAGQRPRHRENKWVAFGVSRRIRIATEMQHWSESAINIYRAGRVFEAIRPRHQLDTAPRTGAHHQHQREREYRGEHQR